MKFNSIGRQGNYSQAGKAVADDALNSFLVARRKSPEYGKIAQDAANIAVYLPRSLHVFEFIAFTSIVIIGLGLLLFYKGGRIQKIVTEKSVVTDVRFATLIDFIYCIILFYFKLHSKVPMSTTWVFIGLLAGRELGMALMKTGDNSISKSVKSRWPTGAKRAQEPLSCDRPAESSPNASFTAGAALHGRRGGAVQRPFAVHGGSESADAPATKIAIRTGAARISRRTVRTGRSHTCAPSSRDL